MEKFVLIDGNSLLNRAFYATPIFTTKDGVPTNGVFGFVKLMLRIIADKKPSYFAVAFDLRAPTFRHKMYDGYKAGRKSMPEELAVQLPILKDVLRLMNVKILELEGFEADDLLGTTAKKFDVQTYIYTGDRDAYQLVDKTTNVCYTKKGVSDILELSEKNFFDELQLSPNQIIDLKALMGDKSDNIPGVAGIGEKTALTLLTQYKDLDGVYFHIDEVKGALHDKLLNGRDSAYFSRQLATICTSAPINLSLSDCILKTPFSISVKEKFAQLEFKSLLAQNIFQENEVGKSEEEVIPTITCSEVYPDNLSAVLNEIKNNSASCIACDFSEKELRFCFFDEDMHEGNIQEYVLPIKFNLLDTGFFANELEDVCRAIFEENRCISCYNVKDCMHRLAEIGVDFTAKFEDISILKCIAEGVGNTDGLTLVLNYHNLPVQNRAFGLIALQQIYKQNLSEDELALYNQVELPLVRVLFAMEQEGVSINLLALDELSSRYSAELAQITKEIHLLAGEEFNINSTQQLGKILFEKLKIGDGAKKKKDSKSYKTTAEELEKYAEDWEIVRQILRYRKIQKLNSTYIDGFKPLIKKGKVHTTYHQNLTTTGRLSSSNPNLQNIPIRTIEGRELRKLFTASEGNVLIDADYSQIELRLLAHFSKCKELIAAYHQGNDIHTATAAQVFNLPIEEVTPELRQAAKAVNFGIIYGISAFGLSNDLKISAKKAKEYIERYFQTYSDVKTYMNYNVETAKEKGYVKTLLGRRRVINELKSSNFAVRSFGERAAMNMPLQGSSADIIKIAMINVYNTKINSFCRLS